MTELLLTTKLSTPSLRKDIVTRPHIQEWMETGLLQDGGYGRKLTLVSAPAGYGKTTLILDWISRSELPTAWLSLDEADNDPRRFITYLIAAMQQVDKTIGQAATSMLQSPQPPPDELMLTSLVNEISAVSLPFHLILDDYHLIHTPLIHKQLAFLLEHQPSNLHLIITTREDPLLPISRLRARDQVLEIRQDDLRFTPTESAQFLKNVMGLDLLPAETAALERRTEGWIAGLQLAALSMRGRDDLSAFIQAFTGSSRFILDYLIEEVFKGQSPDVKDFLLKTSILERLSGSLCDAVMEKNVSQEMLETLEQANLFIVPLDQSRSWYRYHRLFADLLRHRLQISSIPENTLHQRASKWYEKNDMPSDAIRHALAAKDWERAASLISASTNPMLKRGEVMTVISWFQTLPEEVLLSDPKLCLEYCWPLLLAGQYDVAAPLLERVEKVAKEIPTFLGEVFAAQAYLAFGRNDHAVMVEKSQQALALLPKNSVDSRGIVAMNLGLAYWHMGQMQAAKEVLVEALEAGQKTGNHYSAITAIIFLGRVFAVRGQLHQAVGYFERAVQMGGGMPINALAHMDLGTLYYEWNELDKSENHLQQAVLLSQRGQNDEFLTGCWMLQSRLFVAQGRITEAEETLNKAWVLVRDGKVSEIMSERVNTAQVRLVLSKGELLGEWGQKLTEKVDCHPYYRYLGVTKALTLPVAHARVLLDGLGKAAQSNDWGYGLIAIRAMQAALAETQDEASGLLHEALQLGEGGGFIRSFVEAGEKIVPLLRSAIEQGYSPEYANRILAVMTEDSEKVEAGSVTSEAKGRSALIEPLSERELEVLQLVSEGMSNREIAEKLIISTGTAKTHVHNLCGKLGVRNRTEAALKGKELGVV